MNKTKTARQCCSTTTPKTSTHTDKPIITDFNRATRYAAYAICGMFAFMVVWMVVTW